jgi:hypothetical protein
LVEGGKGPDADFQRPEAGLNRIGRAIPAAVGNFVQDTLW